MHAARDAVSTESRHSPCAIQRRAEATLERSSASVAGTPRGARCGGVARCSRVPAQQRCAAPCLLTTAGLAADSPLRHATEPRLFFTLGRLIAWSGRYALTSENSEDLILMLWRGNKTRSAGAMLQRTQYACPALSNCYDGRLPAPEGQPCGPGREVPRLPCPFYHESKYSGALEESSG